jgi:hypothetical protein
VSAAVLFEPLCLLPYRLRQHKSLTQANLVLRTPIAYFACYSGAKGLCVCGLCMLVTLGFFNQHGSCAYSHTLTMANARLVVCSLLSSIALLTLRGITWSQGRLLGGADVVLACLLLTPACLFLIYTVRVDPWMYGHEDLALVRQAYLINSVVSTVSYFVYFAGLWAGFVPIVHGHLLLVALGMIVVYLNCLWSTVQPARTWQFAVKLGLVTMGLAAVLGPGSAASLLWFWREDKLRCRG